MGEKLEPPELATFQRVTGRPQQPPSRIEEALFLVGRRGGKDRAASVLATYLAALVDWSSVLARGERGLVLCIGPDQRQAKIQRDYIEGNFDASPVMSSLISGRTADTIELSNRISIEVRSASFRRLRGVTAVAVIATEAAFWYTDETSGNPDTEILNAVRPSLATTHGPLIIITSPYGRRGEVWNIYRQHYGSAGDPLILVAQGASRAFNETLSETFVQRALSRDPAAGAAEYLAIFRSDLESFVAREAVEACVALGVRERAPTNSVGYTAFLDPAGGSGGDSMTMAIAHREKDGRGVLDAVREAKPPFSPQSVVNEFAATLKQYRIHRVMGDHWGGEFVKQPFRLHGINYQVADKPKSDLYRDALPLINSGKVELLDHPKLVAQLCQLERRVTRAGKDSIDHPPGAHDDLANAVAGALVTTTCGPPPMQISAATLAAARRPSTRAAWAGFRF
jgi:hypothetical protein